jgi:hypothetical protein
LRLALPVAVVSVAIQHLPQRYNDELLLLASPAEELSGIFRLLP